MSEQFEQLWDDLRNAGIVEGYSPDPGEPDSPWFVKALLGFSGWIAALFLLGFLGVAFEFLLKNSAAALIVGATLIGGAYAMLRIPKNQFLEHLALAISLAGQALVVFGLFDITGAGDAFPWLIVAAVQTVLAIFMPNYIHRVLSSCFASIAVAMAMVDFRLPYLFGGIVLMVAAWIWLNEFDYPQHMQKLRAIGYGLILSVTALTSLALFGFVAFGAQMARSRAGYWVQPWMGEVLTGAALIYVVWRILRDLGHTVYQPVAIAVLMGSVAVAAVSMEASGVTAGLTILLLGFAGSNRVLIGLGIASLLFYTSTYYYLQNTTLLDKAQTLLIVGLVLLIARAVIMRVVPKTGGSGRA